MDRRHFFKKSMLLGVGLAGLKTYALDQNTALNEENDPSKVEIIRDKETGITWVKHTQWVELMRPQVVVQLFRNLNEESEVVMEFHESSHYHKILVSAEQVEALLAGQEVDIKTEVVARHWHSLKVQMTELQVEDGPHKIYLG